MTKLDIPTARSLAGRQVTLTPKQQRFVEEYLLDLDPKAAAIRAGYARTTAHCKAWGWVSESKCSKLHVLEAVKVAKAERMERVKVDADWVLERLHAEATADLADLFTDRGALLPVTEWPLIWRQGLVSGLESEEHYDDEAGTTGRTVKLKLSERIKRLELIGKHTEVRAFNGHAKEPPSVTNNLMVKVENMTTLNRARVVIAALRAGDEAAKRLQKAGESNE